MFDGATVFLIVFVCVIAALLTVRTALRRSMPADKKGGSSLPVTDGKWKQIKTKNGGAGVSALELKNGWLVRCGAAITFVPRPDECRQGIAGQMRVQPKDPSTAPGQGGADCLRLREADIILPLDGYEQDCAPIDGGAGNVPSPDK